ncbi:MAG: ornithine carbamoyltransferase [Anaerolineales bacterium]|nr:ornithine carbamoyltransferase [Anaerolineales bacterium]
MKDYLAVADFSAEELQSILDTAIELKTEWKKNGNPPILKDKVLAMIFQKPSLRTRVSFDMAMRHLGGDALYLSPAEIGLGKRESIADIARVLSGYVDVLMARVFDHQHILELGKWSEIPVINGLSDYNHPCQAAADALTIQENFGSLKGIKVTYIGDGNNVAVSLMHFCAKLGADFTIGHPEGYGINPEAVALGEKFAAESGSSISQLNDPREAVSGSQVIYTDTWVSMGQDEEAAGRKEVFPPFQVNQSLLEGAEKDAIVLHCLPAHRGEEITDEVADGPNSRLFPQAHNRLHAQKAILVKLLT